MILTGTQIYKEVQNGNISIRPFEYSFLNPNSYNYRLSDHILEIETASINPKEPIETKRIDIPEEGYQLQPHKLYLGSTYESIGSDKYVISLIGRSSLGRLGLFLQINADLGHMGTQHKWTLELTVVQPLTIYTGMKIGQVSFWMYGGQDLSPSQKYGVNENSYSHYNAPKACIAQKLFDEI